MKSINILCCTLAIGVILGACNSEEESVEDSHQVAEIAILKELSDEEYPDNPDIGIRHEKYTETTMENISFIEGEDGYEVVVIPSRAADDTVRMFGIQLMEFIPTIPEFAKNDEYLASDFISQSGMEP